MLVISKQSFSYLVNQRGEFAHLASSMTEWYDAYMLEVHKTLHQMEVAPSHLLDIGSGLGAYSALLAKNYNTFSTLIDGEDGDGKVHKHNEPFCSRDVVEQFMLDNDVPRDRWDYRNPDQLQGNDFPIYDMVISFRSWCFHYPPETYMQFVREHACPGCRIILDVRKGRGWKERLAGVWHEVETIEEGRKHDRMLYIVRGRLQ